MSKLHVSEFPLAWDYIFQILKLIQYSYNIGPGRS
jgi:hypothetical protein